MAEATKASQQPSAGARWELNSAVVALAAVLVAGVLYFSSDFLLRSDAGVATLLTVTVSLMVTLIAIDVPVAIDAVPGNTLSELLREGAAETTIIPWVFAVFAGRWFHPVDEFSPLGDAGGTIGPVVLIALSWAVVAGAALIRRQTKAEAAVPAWLIVVAGFIAGALLWPVG